MSGEAVALLSALLWALATVLLTMGARRLHVVPLNLLRCIVSTTFFWALLPFYGGVQSLAAISLPAWLGLAASVLLLLVLGDTLFFRSMQLAGVSRVMPVVNITPVWAVVLAWLLVGEPLGWALVAGALLVAVGVALVTRSGVELAGLPTDPGARRSGVLLALMVSVLWALGNVVLKPASAGISAVAANCVRQPMAAMLLLGLTLAKGRWREFRNLDRGSWLIIGIASLVGTGVGSLLFVMAIQLAGAGRTSVLTAPTPVLALPFSVLWLGERPTLWTVVGTVLCVAGVVLVV